MMLSTTNVPVIGLRLSKEYIEKTKMRIIDSIEINENWCWIWKKYRHSGKQSHGRMALMNKGKKIIALVHRVSYYLWKGEIPEKCYILHKCHDPGCCNPAHLEIGDQKKNMRQMYESGRGLKNPLIGENHPRSKLTEKEIIEIRNLHRKKGYGAKKLSKLLNKNRGTIQDIILNKTWRHI